MVTFVDRKLTLNPLPLNPKSTPNTRGVSGLRVQYIPDGHKVPLILELERLHVRRPPLKLHELYACAVKNDRLTFDRSPIRQSRKKCGVS